MAKKHEQLYRLYQRGETWYAYISFTTSSGERVQSRCSCGTTQRATAEQIVLQKIGQIQQSAAIKTGQYISTTIDEAFGRYFTEKAQYQTRPKQTLTRLNNLQTWLNLQYLHQINEPAIASLVAELRQTRSNATVNRYLALLSVILTTAREEWHYECATIKISKFKLPEPAENVKYISRDMVEKIIAAAPQYMRPFIRTAIFTGLRLGNLLALKWENIDFIAGNITIKVKDKNHLGGKNHTIPLLPELIKELQSLPRISEYVFTNSKGKPLKYIATTWQDIFYRWQLVKDLSELTEDDIVKRHKYTTKDGKVKELIYKRVLKDPDIPYINFHTLRHTCGTWMGQAGVNAMVIKDYLGHKDIRTTNKYVHSNTALKRAAAEQVFTQSCTQVVQTDESK